MTELLCERIRRLRKEKRLTQRQVGECFGISHVAVCCWENAVAAPGVERIADLAKLLGVSTHYLLTGREEPRHAALIAAVRRAGTRDPALAALVERA